MIKIKNQRGITIISLIITIVVLLILVSIAIYEGTESVDHSKRMKFMAYMQAIQKKVDYLSQTEGYETLGQELTGISSDKISKLQSILTSDNEDFITTVESTTSRYFNSSAIAEQLDIEDTEDEVIIDFATREVISLNGIKYKGQMYYTQYNLPGGQKVLNNTLEREVAFTNITAKINGLNGTFIVSGISISNGTLSYKLNNNSLWTDVSNNTIKNKNITIPNITKSGSYSFKLVDNNDPTNPNKQYIVEDILLILVNSPNLSQGVELESEEYDYSDIEETQNFAFGTKLNELDEEEEFVWIPRFAYKTENGDTSVEFLRGTSDITTGDKYVGEGWIIPIVFKDLTGVWVKPNPSSSNNIIDIIETGTILQ